VRLTNVEQALQGKQASAATIEAAAKVAGAGLDGLNADMHASSEYRQAMVGVFTRRALEKALSRT
jgi:carbon-monoxide dehydrogenase medium subunit